MQFVIIGFDGTDDGALERRMAVRDEHIARGDALVASGNGLYGGAILDDAGGMIGSVKIVEFETQEEFDDYWANEPYVNGDVWREAQVYPFKVGPSYGNERLMRQAER